MPKRDLDDPAKFARSVLDQVIARHDPEAAREQGKDPAAVSLGLRGGGRGGRARARNLTAEQRTAIAKKAANARWAKKTKA